MKTWNQFYIERILKYAKPWNKYPFWTLEYNPHAKAEKIEIN